MERMQCDNCGHVYDKDEGDSKNNVPAGTAWKDVPEDYKCPECGINLLLNRFEILKKPVSEKIWRAFFCFRRTFLLFPFCILRRF